MQRVVVLGRGGAGKSVFARQLGEMTGLPVIELDQLFWGPELEPMAPTHWTRLQLALADGPRWIIDGDLGPYDDIEPRLGRADTVIVLDMALWLSVWRAGRRGPEQRDFWWWMLRWRRDSRPGLLHAISAFAPGADLVVLRSRRAVRQWLSEIGD